VCRHVQHHTETRSPTNTTSSAQLGSFIHAVGQMGQAGICSYNVGAKWVVVWLCAICVQVLGRSVMERTGLPSAPAPTWIMPQCTCTSGTWSCCLCPTRATLIGQTGSSAALSATYPGSGCTRRCGGLQARQHKHTQCGVLQAAPAHVACTMRQSNHQLCNIRVRSWCSVQQH
jgi:hypothetical protein